jgi:hypothetical protein
MIATTAAVLTPAGYSFVHSNFMLLLKDYWHVITGATIALIFFIKFLHNLAKKIGKIDHIEKDVHELENTAHYVKGKLTTIENLLKKLVIPAAKYGEANSPIVLKEEFKPLVNDSGLKKQIEEKKEKLVSWLKSEDPKTGLDAQDKITDFVVSGEIDKYLDLTAFKELLYKSGKSSTDFYAIISVYLFEILIPELFPSEQK